MQFLRFFSYEFQVKYLRKAFTKEKMTRYDYIDIDDFIIAILLHF